MQLVRAPSIMLRDLDLLTSHTFDLLVVGGGIHGLMAAWDASTRGLHVALIERHDFGSATSFHHHRTLHGGLRYLQTGNLPRLRQSARERRTWAQIAPHFIERQMFAVQAGGPGGKSEALLRAGFALDAALTLDRNRDLLDRLRLPAGRIVNGNDRAGLDTGELIADGPLGVWHDYRTTHAERLTFAVAVAATRAGAVLANYVDAIEPIRKGRTVAGVTARDHVGGAVLSISARVLLNATGAGAGRLMGAFGVRNAPRLIKAMNVVTRRSAPEVACGAATAAGRLLFALPWQGQLAIGTWHGSAPCGADAAMVTSEEFGSLLAEVNQAFPSLHLTEDDVTLVQRGVVPASGFGQNVALADRPLLREHRHDGADGAITLMGVKYTTARALAEQAVTLVTAQLGRHAPSNTASLLLPGQEPTGAPSPLMGLDQASWDHLQRVYGDQAARVASLVKDSPRLGQRLVDRLPIVGAQIVEAVRNEMALTLEDIVLRRTGLGSAGYPGDAAILKVEAIARDELGWSSSRVQDEIQGLKEFYLPVHVAG
jgi:glycerol-3-phosphate dehydrogenase